MPPYYPQNLKYIIGLLALIGTGVALYMFYNDIKKIKAELNELKKRSYQQLQIISEQEMRLQLQEKEKTINEIEKEAIETERDVKQKDGEVPIPLCLHMHTEGHEEDGDEEDGDDEVDESEEEESDIEIVNYWKVLKSPKEKIIIQAEESVADGDSKCEEESDAEGEEEENEAEGESEGESEGEVEEKKEKEEQKSEENKSNKKKEEGQEEKKENEKGSSSAVFTVAVGCPEIIKTGKRKGEKCNRDTAPSSSFCKLHSSKKDITE